MSRENSIKIASYFSDYFRKGWITERDGNACIRLSSDEFLITPSSVRKDALDGNTWLTVDFAENILSQAPYANYKPSIETRGHLDALAGRLDCQASVHVHSPKTVALFYLWKDNAIKLENILNTEWPELFRYTKVGATVPVLYPGSKELHKAMKDSLSDQKIDIVVMQQHGIITRGEDLQQCTEHISRLEHISGILLNILGTGYTKDNL